MKLLIALARALVRCPPPRAQRREGDEIVIRMPPFLAATNPLADGEGYGARQAAALKMMDEDCFGFLLLTVHGDGVHGRVEISARLQPQWWPAVSKTLERVVGAGRTAG